MLNDFKLLVQVIDFVVKACQAYAQTEQGQKELADIASAEADISGSGADNSPTTNAILTSLDDARAFVAGKRK